MKKIFYVMGALILVLLVIILVIRIAYHEPRPQINDGQNAEELAQRMLQAVNKEAWDTLAYIGWSFRDQHHYVWDRVKNDALVKWDDYEVHLDPDEIQGIAYKRGQLLEGSKLSKAIQTAWNYWCNDMFWLAAPFKIRDPGTSLKIAEDEDGKTGLLVTYESGGVTPGDSYLWFLDESGLPSGYKMWVKIIPIGGVYTSWEKWQTITGGAKVSSFHQGNIGALKLEITNIRGGNTWNELGLDNSPIQL